MKKVLIALALVLVTAVAAPAQEGRASNPTAQKVDAEMRALVARVYPAFVIIGGGSGVCISEDGYFVTNHHVWSGAAGPSTMAVLMASNRKRFTADAVGADPRGDIVLGKIRVAEGEKLPFVKLGDSDKIVPGSICLAIGNPFLQTNQPLGSLPSEPTVTLGTVTANHRYQGGYNDCIQIDTPINPGNSGGPSFNVDGEVIGINGRNIASHGKRFNTGAGYAIASNQVRNFIEAMKVQDGGAYVVRHGMVGGLSVKLGAASAGAPVSKVEEGTQAATAGFKEGDMITAIDGKDVFNGYRYWGIVGTKPRGSQFTFKVKRGEETLEIVARNDVPADNNQMLTLPQMADNVPIENQGGVPFALPWVKCSVGAALERNDDPARPGVRFATVSENGPSATAGLMAGDIVTSFNGRPVAYRSDITDALIALKPGTEVKVKYMRDGKEVEATIVTGEAPPAPAGSRQPRRPGGRRGG
jgi:S1-C subfamily serine protease